MLVQRKRILWMLAGIGGLLMIPLIAMQFTDEVNWQLGDFLIMGTVLLSLGLLYEFIAQRSEKTVYKAAFGVGLLGAFLLFWVNRGWRAARSYTPGQDYPLPALPFRRPGRATWAPAADARDGSY